MGKLLLGKLLLGKLVIGEIVVGEIGCWRNCCWGRCLGEVVTVRKLNWGSNVTPILRRTKVFLNLGVKLDFLNFKFETWLKSLCQHPVIAKFNSNYNKLFHPVLF